METFDRCSFVRVVLLLFSLSRVTTTDAKDQPFLDQHEEKASPSTRSFVTFSRQEEDKGKELSWGGPLSSSVDEIQESTSISSVVDTGSSPTVSLKKLGMFANEDDNYSIRLKQQRLCDIGDGFVYRENEMLRTFETRCGAKDDFPCYCAPDLNPPIVCPFCGFHSVTTPSTQNANAAHKALSGSDDFFCIKDGQVTDPFVGKDVGTGVQTCSCQVIGNEPITTCNPGTTIALPNTNNSNNNQGPSSRFAPVDNTRIENQPSDVEEDGPIDDKTYENQGVVVDWTVSMDSTTTGRLSTEGSVINEDDQIALQDYASMGDETLTPTRITLKEGQMIIYDSNYNPTIVEIIDRPPVDNIINEVGPEDFKEEMVDQAIQDRIGSQAPTLVDNTDNNMDSNDMGSNDMDSNDMGSIPPTNFDLGFLDDFMGSDDMGSLPPTEFGLPEENTNAMDSNGVGSLPPTEFGLPTENTNAMDSNDVGSVPPTEFGLPTENTNAMDSNDVGSVPPTEFGLPDENTNAMDSNNMGSIPPTEFGLPTENTNGMGSNNMGSVPPTEFGLPDENTNSVGSNNMERPYLMQASPTKTEYSRMFLRKSPQTVVYDSDMNPIVKGDVCTLVLNDEGKFKTFQRGESYGEYLSSKCINPHKYPCFCNPDLPDQIECPYCAFESGSGDLLCVGHEEKISFPMPDSDNLVETCECWVPTNPTQHPMKVCALEESSDTNIETNTNTSANKRATRNKEGADKNEGGGVSDGCDVRDPATGGMVTIPVGASFGDHLDVEGVCGDGKEWPAFCSARNGASDPSIVTFPPPSEPNSHHSDNIFSSTAVWISQRSDIIYPYCIFTDTEKPVCAKETGSVAYTTTEGKRLRCTCSYSSSQGAQSRCWRDDSNDKEEIEPQVLQQTLGASQSDDESNLDSGLEPTYAPAMMSKDLLPTVAPGAYRPTLRSGKYGEGNSFVVWIQQPKHMFIVSVACMSLGVLGLIALCCYFCRSDPVRKEDKRVPKVPAISKSVAVTKEDKGIPRFVDSI